MMAELNATNGWAMVTSMKTEVNVRSNVGVDEVKTKIQWKCHKVDPRLMMAIRCSEGSVLITAVIC